MRLFGQTGIRRVKFLLLPLDVLYNQKLDPKTI